MLSTNQTYMILGIDCNFTLCNLDAKFPVRQQRNYALMGENRTYESFIGVFIENNSNVFPRIGNNMASNASGKK